MSHQLIILTKSSACTLVAIRDKVIEIEFWQILEASFPPRVVTRDVQSMTKTFFSHPSLHFVGQDTFFGELCLFRADGREAWLVIAHVAKNIDVHR